MSWLEKNGQGLLSLIKDKALLGAIGVIERHLDAEDNDDNLLDVFDVLNDLSLSHPAAEKYRAILEAKEIDSTMAIEQFTLLRKQLEEELPDEYQALGYPLYALSSPPGDIDKEIVWPLLKSEGEITPQIDNFDALTLSLSGEIGSSMVFEAAPAKLPQTVTIDLHTQTKKQLVKIGLKGSMTADVDAKLPLSLVETTASAEGQLKADMSWYFANSEKLLFATALAKNIGNMQHSPFDLEAMAKQLSQTEKNALVCLAVSIDGNQSFSGGIKVSKQALAGVSSVNAAVSAAFNFRVKHGGGCEYTLHNDGNPGPVLSIRRNRTNGMMHSGNLTVDCDFTPLYSKFRSLALDKLSELSQVIEQLDDILPRDNELQLLISNKLETEIESADARALIKAAIGFDADHTASELLADRIMAEVETTTGRWSIDVNAAAIRVADEVLNKLNLKGNAASSLRTMALEQATKIIEHENSRLLMKMQEMLSSTKWDAFAKNINKVGQPIGIIVDVAQTQVNNVIGPIQNVLSIYQIRVKKIRTALEKAAEAKLQAKWSYEHSESDGTALEMQVRFKEINDTSKALYQQMLCGSLDSLINIFRNNQTNDSVEFMGGELERIINLDHSSAFEVNLFGVDLSTNRSLDVDVSYTVNSDGNIRAISKAEITAEKRAWKEGRQLKFVDVFELAVAEKSRSLNINLTLSQNDSDVSKSDVEGFFKSLEEGRLLASGTTKKAIARLADIEAQTPGAEIKGKLEMSFSIEDPAIETLMGLDSSGNQVRSDDEVMSIAVSELISIAEQVSSWEFKLDKETKQCIKRDFPHLTPPLPTNHLQLITVLNDQKYQAALAQTHKIHDDWYKETQLERALKTINQYHQHAANICIMTTELRKTYLSSRNPSNWNEDKYRNTQLNLDNALKRWLKIGSKWFLFLPDEVRPFTVGFIRIMARLAAIPMSQDKSLLNATLILRDQSYNLTGEE